MSNNNVITQNDIYLGECTITTLLTNSVGNCSYANITIPLNIQSGTYYLGAYSDYKSLISEQNESDNIASMKISVNGTSGKDAMHCVSKKDKDKKPQLTNNCNAKVFIIYCYLNAKTTRCGTSLNGGFYTHSRNIEPGKTESFYTGSNGAEGFKYGACIGAMAFTNDGNFKDYPDGSYTCLR